MAKKKIMLLSDDLRMSSGVGTMSREFVTGTIKDFDWVQIGGAIKHPEEGRVVDISDSIKKDYGIKDAYLKIYPISGYGSPEILRSIMSVEKPDAILHYTDPRFWNWLYQMEHELRQSIPIFYYNIWDDLPYPHWNEPFYESCDLMMNISRQTVNIVDKVCVNKPRTDWDNTYVPHGINHKVFYPIDVLHKDYDKVKQFKNHITGGQDYEYIVFWNNRNIRRKLPGDVIMAFKQFCELIGEEKAKKCALIMHTQPIDDNGTDLPKVVEKLLPKHMKVIFSNEKLDNQQMNYIYNTVDVTINIASNEGFGLGTCESLMCGTPIVVNVTGGLQDQCGFKKEDGSYLTVDDYTDEFQSNHRGRYKEHGDWVYPIFPSNISLQGSPPTPYIYDDRCNSEDAAEGLKYFYDMGEEERKECGEKGLEFVKTEEIGMTAENMSKRFTEDMNTAFDKWKPRKRYTLYKA
jgi:glycosyltransferase involved in cell wall biosynthesis